ncbi:MAG: hypothetical protein DWI28_05060 [Planctomycetota bacterium]|nr:MAG: hypothetical protein DWI28_05060 [Planctomycetota bacterium]
MDTLLTHDTANPETVRPLSMEERVDRLEDQVWELRSKINKLSHPNRPTPVPVPKARQVDLSSVWVFLSRVGSLLGLWIMAFLGLIRSWSWLRRGLVLLLGGAILFSNWWLPFSGVWFLGSVFERLVILLLAGVWWYLFVGGNIKRPWDKAMPKKGSRFFGWFRSRAS